MKIKGFAFCFFGMATGDMINLSSPRDSSDKGEQTWECINRKGVGRNFYQREVDGQSLKENIKLEI